MWRVLRFLFGWLFAGKLRVAPPVRQSKLTEVQFAKKIVQKVGGVVEYRLPDDSRVDILTDKHAVEVDWAYKWPEGIGQALYYSIMTNRKPAVLLLADMPADNRFVNRCYVVCSARGIDLWIFDWPRRKLTINGSTVEVP